MKQPILKLMKKIQKKRPEITESSLHTYLTSLRMLYTQYVDGDEEKLKKPLSSKFLHDFNGIKKLLDTCKTKNTCKNRLTAILVGLDAEKKRRDQNLIDKYQALLKDVMVDVNAQIESQEMNRKQSKNWLELDDVKSVTNKLLELINEKNLWKKEKLSKSEYGLIQKYVLLRWYLAYPIRNNVADTAVISQSEYDSLANTTKDNNNYLIREDGNYIFKLNKYKNVKRLGKKSYDINPQITKLLNKWFKINKSGFMFTLTDARTPLNPNGITKVLQSIFTEFADGKKISTSMLRHIQISDDLKDEPTIAEQKAKAKRIQDKYNHSVATNTTYRKIESKEN